jgi:hypothetical protein
MSGLSPLKLWPAYPHRPAAGAGGKRPTLLAFLHDCMVMPLKRAAALAKLKPAEPKQDKPPKVPRPPTGVY